MKLYLPLKIRFSVEIKELIWLYLNFEKTIHLSNYISKKKFDKQKINWDYAAENGHLDIVVFLHTFRVQGCSTRAMNLAASNGHLDIVKFLHTFRVEGCTTYAMDNAARNGHLDIVKFLHQFRTEGCSKYAMDFAAYNGHLEIVEFLKNNVI